MLQRIVSVAAEKHAIGAKRFPPKIALLAADYNYTGLFFFWALVKLNGTNSRRKRCPPRQQVLAIPQEVKYGIVVEFRRDGAHEEN